MEKFRVNQYVRKAVKAGQGAKKQKRSDLSKVSGNFMLYQVACSPYNWILKMKRVQLGKLVRR